jgi:hypothetical protein
MSVTASLGLDSVDALQLVVALDKKYGLKVPDPDNARQVLQSVKTMTDSVAAHLTPRFPSPTAVNESNQPSNNRYEYHPQIHKVDHPARRRRVDDRLHHVRAIRRLQGIQFTEILSRKLPAQGAHSLRKAICRRFQH